MSEDAQDVYWRGVCGPIRCDKFSDRTVWRVCYCCAIAWRVMSTYASPSFGVMACLRCQDKGLPSCVIKIKMR